MTSEHPKPTRYTYADLRQAYARLKSARERHELNPTEESREELTASLRAVMEVQGGV